MLYHCLLASMMSDEKLADSLLRIPCTLGVPSLLLLWRFFVFYNLIMIYLGMGLFDFVLLRVHWDSCIWRLIKVFHQIKEVFCHYVFKFSFCPLLSFLSFLDSQYWYSCWPTESLFIFFILFYFWYSVWIISTDLSSRSSVIFSAWLSSSVQASIAKHSRLDGL